MIPSGYRLCALCESHAFKFEARRSTRKFCEKCQEVRRKERGTDWYHKHRDERREQDNATSRERGRQGRSWTTKAGMALSAADDATRLGTRPTLSWTITVSVPFDYAGSKNATWSLNGRGVIFNRKESAEYKNTITGAVVRGLADSGIEPVHGRLWFDLFVRKPNHRGDALNFVDLASDAIEAAVGIDDRWFSLLGVDWEIVKHEPGELVITIGQESDVYVIACSSCGRVMPLDKFPKNKSGNLHGVSRNCRECVSVGRRMKREDKQ